MRLTAPLALFLATFTACGSDEAPDTASTIQASLTSLGQDGDEQDPAGGERKGRDLMDPKSIENAVNRYHRIYYKSKQTWLQNRWLGVKTQQNPNDIWITQEILVEVKPDFVIETGTNRGGSAMLWAMVLQQVHPTARVITIDIEDRTAEASKLPIWSMIDFYHGSSTDPAIVEEIREKVKGKKVMVLLDSDHSKEHVANEIRCYADLVPVGSYLIVQDTNVNGHPVYPSFGPGPMEAVEELLANDDRFEIDKTRERMYFTMHPNGYLKRVK